MQGVVVNTADGQRTAAPGVDFANAERNRVRMRIGREQLHMQNKHTVTGIYTFQAIVIHPGPVQAAQTAPTAVFTGTQEQCVVHFIRRKQLQMKCQHAVTTFLAVQAVIIHPFSGKQLAVPCIRSARAHRHRIRFPIQRTLTQAKGEHTVATILGRQAVRIVAGCHQQAVAPHIRSTRAHIRRIRTNVLRMDTQIQDIHTITAVVAMQTVIINAANGQRTSAPCIHIRGTDRHHGQQTVYGTHLQVKMKHTVASVHRYQTILIIT